MEELERLELEADVEVTSDEGADAKMPALPRSGLGTTVEGLPPGCGGCP